MTYSIKTETKEEEKVNRIESADQGVVRHLSTYGLALFLFLTPFEYPLVDLMSVSPLRIVGLFAMALAVADIWMQRIIKLDYRFIYVVLWLLYGLVSYVWALDQERFRSYFSIYMNNALMFLLFSLISFTKYEAELLKKATIFGIGALLLYMTFVPDAVVYSSYQHRLTLKAGDGTLDQNYLAALMLVSFGMVFYKLCNVEQKRKHRTWSILFCAAIAYYIFLTGSRSGLIALVLIVMLSINTSWKTRLSIGIPVVLLILVVIPFAARFLPENLLERFSLSALTGKEAESGTRFLIWAQALKSIKGFKWVFGLGVGASQTAVGNVLEKGKDMAIHNHYLAMLAEVGVMGFLFINIPIFRMNAELWKKDKGYVVAFSGILLMAVFLDVVTAKFFWSAMVLMSVLCTANRQKSDA